MERGSFFDVSARDASAKLAAWTYERPRPLYVPVAGYLAFYAGLVDAASVGGLRVIPQPGDFYGG